jgi:hypothetical protein
MKKIQLSKSILYGLCLILPIHTYASEQWASTVIGFSSQYGTTSWSAKQALKQPNTNSYGDYSTAWAPDTQDAGSEFLSLGFPQAVYATGVTIRETNGYGFVTGVDVIDTNNMYHNVWRGVDNSKPGVINNLKITWPITDYLVKGVKIYMDTAIYNGWEEIDAVKLYSYDTLSGTIAPRLTHSAQLECTNNQTSQTVSAVITGSGTTSPVTQWDCGKAGLKFSSGDSVSFKVTGTIK